MIKNKILGIGVFVLLLFLVNFVSAEAIPFNSSLKGNLSTGTTSAIWSVLTNENATCKYSLMPGLNFSEMTGAFSTTGAMNHSISLSGLSGGKVYNYFVKCQNETFYNSTEDYRVFFYVGNWTPPIGIPDPAERFGWPIDRATPAWPANWTNTTTSAATNYYYVDETHVNASNTGNTYGHPGRPRATPPEGTLTAGAFVYIHAGEYNSSESGGTRWDWVGVGNSTHPIWITGNPNNFPNFTDLIGLGDGSTSNLSYLIFENFHLVGPAGVIDMRPTTNGNTIDHVIIRNILKEGTQGNSDNGGIGVGLSSATDSIYNSNLSDIVVYNNIIRYIGNKTNQDTTGVYMAYHTNRVWALDNVIYSVGADSIAGSHYSNYENMTAERYYVGRNFLYANGENGIDLKNIHYTVISQNYIRGPFTREQGAGIVLHYGAVTQYHVRDAAVIYNTIHHVSGGISTGGSSGADNLSIIGNLIYDVNSSYAALPDVINGKVIFLGGSDGKFFITDNTFYNYEAGIEAEDLDVGDSLKIHGNIFARRNNNTNYDIAVVNGEESRITSNYNRFPDNARFYWTNTLRNLTYMQNTAGQEANSSQGNVTFVNATSDFRLNMSSSFLIDTSVEGPVGDSAYDVFFSVFNRSIKVDFNNVSRPQGTNWDFGAFEFVDSTIPAVTLLVPVNGTNTTVGTTSFNATFTDDAQLLNATLFVWNSTNSIINQTNYTITGTSNYSNVTFTFPYQGTFKWNYLVYDNSSNGAWGNTNYTINYDYTPPTVTLLAPANASTTYSKITSFNATFTDNLALMVGELVIWNSTNSIINQTNYTITGTSNYSNVTFTFPYQGVFWWNYKSYGVAGNSAYNDSNYTINYTDLLLPEVSISYPSNTTYTTNVSTINYTYSDENIAYCWYSNETTNFTAVSCGANFTGVVSREGSNTWRIYANDTNGNINSTSVTFYKDTVYPQFVNYTDNTGTLTTSGTATFNVTVTNTNGTVLLEINGANYTASNLTASNYNVSISLSGAGTYTYYWHSYGSGNLRNFNFSTSNTYTINSPATGNTGSSGGGGGGGGATVSNATSKNETIEKEIPILVNSDKGLFVSENQIKGSVRILLEKNSSVNFELENKSHTLSIEDITKDSVTVVIQSEPQKAMLKIGEEKLFELDGDNYYDLSVILQSIENDDALIIIKNVHYPLKWYEEIIESAGSKNNKEISDGLFYTIIIGSLIILIIILSITLVYVYIKRAQRAETIRNMIEQAQNRFMPSQLESPITEQSEDARPL